MKSSIDDLRPVHVAAGIGGAERDFLAVCLGAIDDATLQEHLMRWLRKTATKIQRADPKIGDSVNRNVKRWQDSDLSAHHLRAVLWIKLQRALRLNPSITRSVRGAERLADELVAAGLEWQDDSASDGWAKRVAKVARAGVSKGWDVVRRAPMRDEERDLPPPKTLGNLVAPLFQEMLKRALGEDPHAMPEQDKERLATDIVARLDEKERQALLREVGESDVERAIVKLAVGGGSHGSFAVAVGATGFAPYILAAQASAFIPMVSGPALVSVVSVVANPVVVVAAAVGFGAHLTRKANERATAQVALTLIALLACDGMARSREALENLVASFETLPELPYDDFDIASVKEASAYREAWARLQDSWLAPPGLRTTLAGEWERKNLHGDSVAIGAASIGDLVYSLAAIDPQVVAAADFASSETIEDAVDFAAHLLGKVQTGWLERAGIDLAAQKGNIANLKGFTMEQLVATKLADDGHTVELPDNPNQPGWDLIVDGERFQVKCLADSSGLTEHFEKYPEIPVFANGDLMAECAQWPQAWQEKVFFIEGHTNEVVEAVVGRSYGEGMDLAESDVPEIALAYVAARQAWKLKKGEITAGQAMSHLLMEGSARAGLALAGGVAGSSVGFLLLGPAGALVVGNLLPVVAQSAAPSLIDRIRGRPTANADEEARCEALGAAVEKAIDRKLSILRAKYRQAGDGPVGRYVRHRLLDEARHLDECQDRLFTLSSGNRRPPERAVAILRIASQSVHRGCYQAPLAGLKD